MALAPPQISSVNLAAAIVFCSFCCTCAHRPLRPCRSFSGCGSERTDSAIARLGTRRELASVNHKTEVN
eukprot:6172272-Pleurochrysis_carterae.AAC.2